MIARFSLRITLFLIPVLLVLGGLEWMQHQLPNNYSHKKACFEAKLDQWETLILGSSHSYLGVDPSQLDSRAYNLAFTAQTLCFDQYLLARYIEQMPALRRVILPISYGSLSSESYRNPGIYDKTYYYAQFYGSRAFTDWWDLSQYSRVSLFTVKRSVDRTRTYYTRGDTLLECRRDGFYGMVFQRDLEQNGQESGFFHDQYFFESLFPTNLAYLHEIANLCEAHGVQLYLISTPMWPSYLAHIRPDRLTMTTAAIDSFAQTRDIPYWNDLEGHDFTEADFYDANHLSAQGAVKYTHLLQHRIGIHETNHPLAVSP